MFTGCACCGACGDGSIEAGIVTQIIRSAATCTFTWTDNGVWEEIDASYKIDNTTGIDPYFESDIPPQSIDLSLDLARSAPGGTQVGFRYGRRRVDNYTVEMLFLLTSNTTVGTAWPSGPCRVVAVGTLSLWANRFALEDVDRIATASVTFTNFTIADDLSSMESQSPAELASFTNEDPFQPNKASVFSPMGIRLEL